MQKYNIIFLILLLPGLAMGANYTLTSDSLPWTSPAGTDTVFISGTMISATGDAIILQRDGIVLDGQNDTIMYNSGGGSGTRGIKLSGTGTIVQNLWIVEAQDTSATGSDNDGIYLLNPSGAIIRGCKIVTYSDETQGIDSYGTGTYTKNLTIDTTDIWNYCSGYDQRQYYEGGGMRLELRNPTLGAGEFSCKMYGNVIHTSSHVGICVFGAWSESGTTLLHNTEIQYCSTYVDHQNDWYTFDDGLTGHSSANAYGILIGSADGTLDLHNNYIGAGTEHGGSRGLMLEKIDGAVGDTAEIYNNTIDIHCGRDVRYGATRPDDTCDLVPPETGSCAGAVSSWAVRIRDIDSSKAEYINFHDNSVKITLKAVPDTQLYLAYGSRGTAICVSETNRNGGDVHDAHFRIYNNTFEVAVDSNGSNIDGDASRIFVLPMDTSVHFFNNVLIAPTKIINAQSGSGVTWTNDSLKAAADTNNFQTIAVGLYNNNYICTALVATDCYFCDPADSSDINYATGGTLDFTVSGGTVGDCSGEPTPSILNKKVRIRK